MLVDERVSFKVPRPSCGRLYVPHEPFYISRKSILEDITMRYAGDADRLLAELKVVKQESGESVGSYGQSLEILLNRLLNTYDPCKISRN